MKSRRKVPHCSTITAQPKKQTLQLASLQEYLVSDDWEALDTTSINNTGGFLLYIFYFFDFWVQWMLK